MFNKDPEKIKNRQSAMNNIKTEIKNILEGNPPTLLVGMQTSTATMENSVEIPYKTGNRTHMTQKSHSWAYTPRKPELKEPCVPQCSSQNCL